LFNILGADLVEASFLDLFAGTGSVGIEALSRGANLVWFIDNNHRAIQTVRSNLKITELGALSRVLKSDAFTLLNSPPQHHFDYIYIAPPQYKNMWIRALQRLDANPGWLSDDAWIIVQIDPIEYSINKYINFIEFDQRRYGSTLLVFYQRSDI
jgi:16S rRNA (guanine(966)-N(2))-methyltransferase RsmD